MGFLQLIPATKIEATYLGEVRTLVLRAQGQAQNYTSGIHFAPQGFVDGHMAFALEGMVGPIGPGTKAYDHVQRFENMEYPGAFVMVKDAGHPAGVPVRVEPTPATQASTPEPTMEVRRIPLGGELEVRAAVWEQPGATQSLEQDPAYLALQSAGIQNPSSSAEIVWTLRGIKLGETKVKQVSIGGITPLVTSRTIQVIIEALPSKK